MNENFLKNHLKTNKYDIIIAVDKGLEILDKLEITPNYLIGDFDSVDSQILQKYQNSKIEISTLIPEKDFTDTEAALELAINLKSNNITIIGAIGTRIDHTIANIHVLKKVLDKKIKAKIIDENNEIQLINSYTEIEKDENYKYISIIPLTTEVTGLTLTGFKYTVKNYTLQIGISLGVSNEQLEDIAKIQLSKGILIIIKSKD